MTGRDRRIRSARVRMECVGVGRNRCRRGARRNETYPAAARKNGCGAHDEADTDEWNPLESPAPAPRSQNEKGPPRQGGPVGLICRIAQAITAFTGLPGLSTIRIGRLVGVSFSLV